jgi:uncharacterized protein YjbI with pentapeptide repeats
MGEYILNQCFSNHTEFAKGEYEACTFTGCDFSNLNISEFIFTDCEFLNCDFSNAKLSGTAFRDVRFNACKLMGLQFSECNTFSLSFHFEHCVLDFSSFYQLKIKKTIFQHCKLTQVDFVEAELSQSQFINCDLSGAVFDRTNLEKVDFLSASNFVIDPELNNIRQARFSQHNLSGLLVKYNIVIK